ncbi:MAG: hypothetical protein HWE10_07690 [Gammaproteobacteria bacterium]|nr:hypothetical protein [Gammaproteobacteria bacterium]
MRIFWLLLSLLITSDVSSKVIKTIGPQREHDKSHQYFTELLSMALVASEVDFELQIVERQSQYRDLQLLTDTELIDIAWTGNSDKRDEVLHRVPFPLFLGGLGVRGSIIRKDFADDYASISSMNDLKKYVFCQGLNWPDANILKGAGLSVYGATKFDSILKMVELKRCDLFPLSILEGEGELTAVKELYPDLMFSTSVLLHYQLNMFYYVKKSNTELADKVLSGLEILRDNGALYEYMKNHPLTRSAFPLNQFRHSTFLNMDGSHNQMVEQMKGKSF